MTHKLYHTIENSAATHHYIQSWRINSAGAMEDDLNAGIRETIILTSIPEHKIKTIYLKFIDIGIRSR